MRTAKTVKALKSPQGEGGVRPGDGVIYEVEGNGEEVTFCNGEESAPWTGGQEPFRRHRDRGVGRGQRREAISFPIPHEKDHDPPSPPFEPPGSAGAAAPADPGLGEDRGIGNRRLDAITSIHEIAQRAPDQLGVEA